MTKKELRKRICELEYQLTRSQIWLDRLARRSKHIEGVVERLLDYFDLELIEVPATKEDIEIVEANRE